MDKAKARKMLETAMEYVGDDVFVPMKFEDVDLRTFLAQYLWCIYVAGFRNAVVEKHITALMQAFADLDLERIVEMESIDAQSLPIRNQLKADAFLKGCKQIHDEGWDSFKERVSEHGRAALVSPPHKLPWMGPAASRHLAMILGIEDTAKPDVWIAKCAAACSATVDEMVTFLSEEYDITRQQVDGYLWRYCVDHQDIPR